MATPALGSALLPSGLHSSSDTSAAEAERARLPWLGWASCCAGLELTSYPGSMSLLYHCTAGQVVIWLCHVHMEVSMCKCSGQLSSHSQMHKACTGGAKRTATAIM